MKRLIYHVVWRGKKWHVRRLQARRSTKTFTNKKRACRYAELRSLTVQFCQVIVHGKNGKIQHEHTYGGDPRSTAG